MTKGCAAAEFKNRSKNIPEGIALARSLIAWLLVCLQNPFILACKSAADFCYKKLESIWKPTAFQGEKQSVDCLLRKQLSKMPPGREGQMPEPHITAHSGIRCDTLCLFIAGHTSFTVIINQRHQYLTELNGLTALGKDASEPFLLFMVRGFYVTQWKQVKQVALCVLRSWKQDVSQS